MSTGKLPPYGRQIYRYPLTQETRVYFGDSPQIWEHCKVRQAYGPAILLPSSENYDAYQWPVKGREIFMLQIGQYPTNEIPCFARVLLIAGAVIVRVLYPGGLATFRPQRSVAT